MKICYRWLIFVPGEKIAMTKNRSKHWLIGVCIFGFFMSLNANAADLVERKRTLEIWSRKMIVGFGYPCAKTDSFDFSWSQFTEMGKYTYECGIAPLILFEFDLEKNRLSAYELDFSSVNTGTLIGCFDTATKRKLRNRECY